MNQLTVISMDRRSLYAGDIFIVAVFCVSMDLFYCLTVVCIG